MASSGNLSREELHETVHRAIESHSLRGPLVSFRKWLAGDAPNVALTAAPGPAMQSAADRSSA